MYVLCIIPRESASQRTGMTAAGCRQHCTTSKIARSAEPPHSSDYHQSTSVITYYGHKSITVYLVAILSITPWVCDELCGTWRLAGRGNLLFLMTANLQIHPGKLRRALFLSPPSTTKRHKVINVFTGAELSVGRAKRSDCEIKLQPCCSPLVGSLFPTSAQ